MATHFKVHFIGIGGIGVSALARYYLREGWRVSGSDLAPSEITAALTKLGAECYIGPRELKKSMPDIVIYSPAVPASDPELKEAKKLEISVMSYPEALGQLTKKYCTIAVAGAHGKSTTTAMIGLILKKAGLDPTVIVGTKVREFGDSNFLYGKSRFLVIEACEYARSFLNYWPKMAVITNIEVDHLECYKNLNNLVAAFREFAGHLPQEGVLVANRDDAGILKMLSGKAAKISNLCWYSLKQKEKKRVQAVLKIPGDHNVANALAALAVARKLGVPDKKTLAALASYRGVWRRFDEIPGRVGKKRVTLVSDYGHHPTQIKATLEGARSKWPNRRIVCVFQPHQALRTHLLFSGFVKVLKTAPVDRAIITDIYQVAGRESAEISRKVSAEKLAAATKKDSVEYVPRNALPVFLEKNIEANDVLVIMGAGNIYDLAKAFFTKTKNSPKQCRNS